MHHIGVIPENPEISGGRLQSRHSADNLVAVGYSLGIGIFRHAPYALYLAVLHKLLHRVHIRAFGSHSDRYKLKAEIFGNGKMTVISRNRADKLKPVLLTPRLAAHAVSHRLSDGIEHHVERGIPSDYYLVGLKLKNLSEKGFKLGETVKSAVIPAVYPAYILEAGIVADKIEHFSAQVHIVKPGFSP